MKHFKSKSPRRTAFTLLEMMFVFVLIGILATHYGLGPAIAFGIPGALMFVSTFILWIARKQYVMLPPTGCGRSRTIWAAR